MNTQKKKPLAAAGWVVGDAAEFLELTAEERSLVELRLAVSRAMHYLRKQSNLTQQAMAQKLNTTQSRIAKMESASSDVSLDALFAGLFALGGSMEDLTTRRASTNVPSPSSRRAKFVAKDVTGKIKTGDKGGVFYPAGGKAKYKATQEEASTSSRRAGKLVPKK